MAGQYVAYTFFRVDPAWRRLPLEERAAGKDAFAEVVEDWAGRMDALRAYSVTGVRPDCDLFLWKITERYDDLGAAYRASGRSKPLIDAFAIHPYMQASRDSPTAAHPDNTTITLADYPKLVRLLAAAFRGTHQEAAHLPVYYTEFGVQTPVPGPKRRFYADLASAASTDTVPYTTQAAYYRRALELAYCQPTVRALFVVHTFDEPSLDGWQSGLYFADGTPKPSLAPFRRAVADLRAGRFPSCRR